MKNNKLAELTSEQLEARKKTLTGALIGLAIVMVIACSVLFYIAITKKNYALMTVCTGCFITLLPSVIGLKQINTEIKSRESKYIK